jgi:8-oxo-dGTP diphosphatase
MRKSRCYVAGFLFDSNAEKIALIEKQRPEWQRWQLNGIGGKIERNRQNCMCYENDSDQINFDPCICPMEKPVEAQRREFREETGVDYEGWMEFCLLDGPDYEVHFFYGFDNRVFEVKTKTDEKVSIYETLHVLDTSITHPLIPNLRWLIPMALSMVYTPGVKRYHVTEELVYV